MSETNQEANITVEQQSQATVDPAVKQTNTVATEVSRQESKVQSPASHEQDKDFEAGVSKLAEKLSPHIGEVVTKAVEDKSRRDEDAKVKAEFAEKTYKNFRSNFDRFSKESPEVAKQVQNEIREGGKLDIIGQDELATLFTLENAPEVLAGLLDNKKELDAYRREKNPINKIFILRDKNTEIRIKKKLKSEPEAMESSNNSMYSNAPEPSEKIREGRSFKMSSLKDYMALSDEDAINMREQQMRKKRGY